MRAMDYASYLQLDTILGAQALESTRRGTPAHDEMLFVVIHQTYELWFKQILHELAKIQDIFAAEDVADAKLGEAVHTLTRVTVILQHLVRQVDILETMTPMDFLEFRDVLRPASGFQSAQFRMIETMLGLPRAQRLPFDGRPFDALLTDTARAQIASAETKPSIFDGVAAWLARMPFLETRSFDFGDAILAKFQESEERVTRMPGVEPAEAVAQKAAIARQRHGLKAILDDEIYSYVQPEQKWRLPRRAMEAALFILLYREMPLLQQPWRVLSLLMDIDEQMGLWRTRHMMMVGRMIGQKIGTGGSSGAAYLEKTVAAHRIFADLFSISTYLIPMSMRPELPAGMKRAMSFPGSGA
jgi:tryptophan 2,3-dioxygenase